MKPSRCLGEKRSLQRSALNVLKRIGIMLAGLVSLECIRYLRHRANRHCLLWQRIDSKRSAWPVRSFVSLDKQDLYEYYCSVLWFPLAIASLPYLIKHVLTTRQPTATNPRGRQRSEMRLLQCHLTRTCLNLQTNPRPRSSPTKTPPSDPCTLYYFFFCVYPTHKSNFNGVQETHYENDAHRTARFNRA